MPIETSVVVFWSLYVALSGKLNSFDALYKMYNDEELLEQPE